MSDDIIQALKETMKEQAKDRSQVEKIEKIAILKRYFGYAVDLLDIVLNIQRDRRYKDYYW